MNCSTGREALLTRRVGDASVTVTAVPDDDWYYMQDSRYVTPREAGEFKYNRYAIVARNEMVVRMPGQDIWRDARGRIAAEPETSRYARECEFIAVPYVESGKDAIQLAEYLEKCERGDIGHYGIVALVFVDGAQVGEASVWNVDCDHYGADSDRYLRIYAREQAREAIHEARAWLNRRVKAAS